MIGQLIGRASDGDTSPLKKEASYVTETNFLQKPSKVWMLIFCRDQVTILLHNYYSM